MQVTFEVSPTQVTLALCPPGLFVHNGNLGIKTEYRCPHNEIEAYVAASGEYFWGGTNNTKDRLNVLVNPVPFQSFPK